jgi:AcrR family transcriptional regulator
VGSKAPTDTRARILEAAKGLLRRYGPNKLTVVDIARELGMSHANVYRFYKTKSKILDAISDEWLTQLESFVEEIARRRTSAAARIEAVVLELHRKRKKKFLQDAEVFEAYRRIVEVRPEVAERRREKIQAVFQRLLEEGIESGDFRPMNCLKVATALKDATAMFLHPLLIPGTINQPTEARARNVVRFILAGCAKTKSKDQSRIKNKARTNEGANAG